jgi:formylglycine-generating enzyme required for sulfatase activity
MTRFLAYITLLICVALWPHREGECSNLKITNPILGTLSGGSTTVSFDITWTNSWRTVEPGAPAPNNWDAAWVFVKYRKNGGDWAHASLNDTGHSVGTGTAATYSVGYPDTSSSFNIATNPGVGVFLYRSGDGTGTFTLTGAGLSWNYAQDGVATNDTVEIRVFGIEMVYVPDGAFFAGDNATSTGSFRQGSSDNDPWYIASEDAITTANAAGTGTGLAETAAEYYYVSLSQPGEDATGSAFTIPAEFPKGYRRFYIMKGEVSQGQYVAFFNTLAASQRTQRDITATKTDNLTVRNNISWTSGDATLPDQGGGATYEHVAMNYMSLADLVAFLDWSGLRPMSELEFERAARGPYRSVSKEFAWGSTSITQATTINNGGLPTERGQSGSNVAFGSHASVQGPVRVGSFAYGVSTRIASGAGYYGAMDLSGNLSERTVTVGMSAGRSFQGRYHGNGSLDSIGRVNQSTWPTQSTGAGQRGGNWTTPVYAFGSQLCISDRGHATLGHSSRFTTYGGRGVRSAP